MVTFEDCERCYGSYKALSNGVCYSCRDSMKRNTLHTNLSFCTILSLISVLTFLLSLYIYQANTKLGILLTVASFIISVFYILRSGYYYAEIYD
jgi:hypothetical protein